MLLHVAPLPQLAGSLGFLHTVGLGLHTHRCGRLFKLASHLLSSGSRAGHRASQIQGLEKWTPLVVGEAAPLLIKT